MKRSEIATRVIASIVFLPGLVTMFGVVAAGIGYLGFREVYDLYIRCIGLGWLCVFIWWLPLVIAALTLLGIVLMLWCIYFTIGITTGLYDVE